MEKQKKTMYTQAGYDALVEELEYLKGTKIQEVKKNLAEARAFGDLSENSEYDEAKNEQSKVVGRIQELEELILNAEIINESEIKADVVHLGAIVTVYDEKYDEEITYNIVGTNEADPLNDKISDQSPIGSAMLGSRAGDEVTVETPEGEYKLKILEVRR